MKKIKFRYLKYKNKEICLGYCGYDKIQWYATYIDGIIAIVLDKKLSRKLQSSILHKIIKIVSNRKY